MSTLLRFAKFFAATKHAGQQYGSLPYTHHLAAVEAVLRRFQQRFPHPGVDCWQYRDDEEELAAAWLHDCVEDTGTKIKEIRENFGDRVADLVAAVTNEPGENRKVRAALTYPKIRQCPGATRLKLADRIANVENGGAQVAMYRKEHEDFRRSLYVQGENERMWEVLDALLR